jgi:hypothetical protein
VKKCLNTEGAFEILTPLLYSFLLDNTQTTSKSILSLMK